MKKIFVFLVALTFLMLIAIPATAGPSLPTLAIFDTAVQSIFVAPEQVSLPAVSTIYFAESRPPFFAQVIAHPFIATESTTAKTTTYLAFWAMLAAIMGLGLISMIATTTWLKYDIRDRMHGLPRDQDASA